MESARRQSVLSRACAAGRADALAYRSRPCVRAVCAPLEHFPGIRRGERAALQGAEQRGRAPVQSLLVFRTPPAVDEAEGGGIKAHRAGFLVFSVVDPERSEFPIEVPRLHGARASAIRRPPR